MRTLTLIFMFSLLGCNNQGAGPGAPEECAGQACEGIYGASDQNSVLQLERTYTNSRDILVSWPENPAISESILNIAIDPNCLTVQKSLTVTGSSTHLIDLEEGVWYLCLKSASGGSQRLVVDRQIPKIEGEATQALASGNHVNVKVSDATEAQCNWSSSDSSLRLTDAHDVLTPFSTTANGTYTATLSCEDQAENTASQTFTLTMTAGTPGQPNNVKTLVATPGTNSIALTWTDGGDGVSYVVLESSATITAAPADGMVYTAGSMIGAAQVKQVGPTLSFTDTGLAGNSQHFYKVFAANALGRYATGVEVNATAIALKTLKATLTRSGSLSFSEAIGLRTAGNYSYVCRGDDGLGVINVTNPAAPTTVTTLSLGNNGTVGWCSDVKVQGNYAYVADWDRGLIIVDITNPLAPVQKGSVALTNASVMHVEGNFAYVALEDGTSGGLAVVNITNPNTPTLAGSVNSGGNVAGVAKAGNFVYLAHRDSGNFKGLKVYDVSNLNAITQVRSFGRSTMEEIEIVGNFAYVTVGTAGLEIFDVTNPGDPVSKSTTPLTNSGFALSVNIVDNYAFVSAQDASRMFVLDVTNKTNPTIVRNYTTLSNARWIHVSGANAYITSRNGSFEIVEVFQFQ